MLTKLIIFNFTALCAVIAGTYAGFVLPFFLEDITYLTYAILAVFLYGLAQIFYFATGFVKDHRLIRFRHVSDVYSYLTGLGIVGTCVGIYFALQAAQIGGDASQIKDFTTTVLEGTKAAFGATIVATLAFIWHHVNCRIVHTQLTIEEG